jgi:peptidoglycan hydrolase-like protein with peptidoglycan-binding domain
MALPIPGGALANAAIKGASKAANVGRAVAGTGINLGAQYAVGKGVNAANKSTLGYDPTQYPSSPEAVKAFQAANGLTPDGIIGPKTKAVLDKQGLTAPSVQEQISSLRDRLAMIESETEVAEAMPNLGAMWNAAKTGVGKFTQGVKTGMKDLTPQQADMAKNLAGTSNKAGQKVGGAVKAVKNNPGTTAGAALAAGGGAMALGGGAAASPAGTTIPTPTLTTNKTNTGPAATTTTTTGAIDPAKMAEIEALMAELAQFDDPAIQQALVGARQTLSKVTGNNAIGAADQAAQQADLNTAGDVQ